MTKREWARTCKRISKELEHVSPYFTVAVVLLLSGVFAGMLGVIVSCLHSAF